MDRLRISGNVPAELAERISDVGAELTLADEVAIQAESERLVRDSDWWGRQLEGINALTNELPAVVARCMANLDSACAGSEIARDAITTALHNLQKLARKDAHDDATEKYYDGKLEDPELDV